MNPDRRPITDEELDALLTGKPVTPSDAFAERTILKSSPVTFAEVDSLLTGRLVSISSDFTERTLSLIEEMPASNLLQFPGAGWVLKSGMIAAVLLVGLFSYSVWQQTSIETPPVVVAQSNLATMELEELLYLEETLTSAKFLIELDDTLPINYFFDAAD